MANTANFDAKSIIIFMTWFVISYLKVILVLNIKYFFMFKFPKSQYKNLISCENLWFITGLYLPTHSGFKLVWICW